ncbi:MAG: EAL domain-containing protein [Actinomycetota bacterium]|nr:EAL domain-containing protein [Actinomycetota bacterium]
MTDDRGARAMQPDGNAQPDGSAHQPSAQLGLRVAAVGLAIVLVVLFAALASGEIVRAAGFRWTALSLLGLSLLGMRVAWWRARREEHNHWRLLVGAFAASAAAEASISLDVAHWVDEQWPSIADAGTVGFELLLIAFFVRHLDTGSRRNLYVHLFDALLLALGGTFMVWELVISSWFGDPSQHSLTTQIFVVAYPLIDLFVCSMLLLLLLVARSPARVAAFVGAVGLTVGDVLAGAVTGTDTPRLVAGGIAWVVGYLALITALVLPAGGRMEPARPTLGRLALVHGSVAVGLWVATWRYVVHQERPTAVAAGIGMMLGVLWLATQVAGYHQSREWARQLHDNIGELQQTQEELRALLDDLPSAVVVLSRGGRIREVNGPAMVLTGLDRDQMLGRYFTDLFEEPDRPQLLELWRQLHTGAPMANPTLTFHRPDGSKVLLEGDSNLPLRNPDRVVLALRDVTQRVEEASRFERARERFRLAFHGAPTGMALSSSVGGLILDVNESLVRMLGRPRDDLVGRTVEEISHPDDWQRTAMVLAQVGETDVDNYRVERRYLRGDGGVVWARTWVSVMDDGEGGSLAISHIEDVTEQRHNEERLEWAASHDGLTGLPNRFRFLERLGVYLETAEAGSIAMLFIDLDNFKVINDSLGHGAGDQLLQAMSERLRSVVRDRDMLGRFGGDEFIVMLRDVSGAYDPLDVAERLRAEIAKPLVIEGAELFVTASIGITLSDREGVTTSEMMRDADAAMYRAKARGRDRVEVFSPGSHDATVLTLRTTNELRRGLERGEIVPYYQPIVQLGNGHLVGFEVLARWRHPDRGLLGPDQFLPMAEETGLIGEVGAAVLRASLAQLGQWRNSNRRFADLSVSVNVSVRQLMSGHLVDVVSDALVQAGVSASALWLEITETALMADVKAATIALRELRSLGLHLAVDDFGTGYSSLTYLKRFPVEAIKVDRTFVNGLGIDSEDSTIVEAVVKLGHSLGLSVVAEGVETPLQLARLREIGCDRGQGYLFGRPRPAELVAAEYSLV